MSCLLNLITEIQSFKFKNLSCKAVHQSLPGTKLTGLWCNNSLSFNLIYFVFFSSSFVCLFPWFWLLSFLRRYVHLLFPNASPSLSSQVLLVVRHAFVLFLIFYTFAQGVLFSFFFVCKFFKILISCLSIDSFELQMFVCSVFHWAGGLSTLFYLCGWLPGGCRVHLPPRGFGSGSWCFVSTLLSSLTLFSLYAVVVILFDLCFWKLQYSFFSIQRAQQRTFAWLSKLITNPLTQLARCFFALWLHGKRDSAPFQQCGSALLML